MQQTSKQTETDKEVEQIKRNNLKLMKKKIKEYIKTLI